MPETLETDYLKPFIESTIAAAARFRRILIVMVTASILAFGSFWNSASWGWFNSRLELTRGAVKLLTLEEANWRLTQIEKELVFLNKQMPTMPEKENLLIRRSEEKENLLRDVNNLLGPEIKGYSCVNGANELKAELEKEVYKKFRDWIERRKFYTRDQAAEYAQKLDEARTQNILLVKIPFFGIVFDVNDLGLLGGITFVVLLLLLRFSLWREYNNLSLTFLESKADHLKFCYKSLAMQQVLTVPLALPDPPTSYKRKSKMIKYIYLFKFPHKPGRRVVRYLYILPFAVQFFIFIHDLKSRDIGMLISCRNTVMGLVASVICLCLIVYFIVQCYQLSVAIDKEWDKAAERIREIKIYKRQVEQ